MFVQRQDLCIYAIHFYHLRYNSYPDTARGGGAPRTSRASCRPSGYDMGSAYNRSLSRAPQTVILRARRRASLHGMLA